MAHRAWAALITAVELKVHGSSKAKPWSDSTQVPQQLPQCPFECPLLALW
jgi:hypothetical protein